MKKIQSSAFFVLLMAMLGAGATAHADQHRSAEKERATKTYLGVSVGRFQGGATASFGENQAAGTGEFSGIGKLSTQDFASSVFLGVERDTCKCLPNFSWGLEVRGALLGADGKNSGVFQAAYRDPENLASIRDALLAPGGDANDPYIALVNGPGAQGLQALVNGNDPNDALATLGSGNLLTQLGSFTLDRQSSYSVHLKLGWNWQKWYFYGLGGLSQNRFATTVAFPEGIYLLSDTDVEANNGGRVFAAGDLSSGRIEKNLFSSVSGNYGAGIRYRISPKLSASFRYLYIKSDRKTLHTDSLLAAYEDFRSVLNSGNDPAAVEDQAIANLADDVQANIKNQRDNQGVGNEYSATSLTIPDEIVQSIRQGVELEFDNHEQFELIFSYLF